MDATRLARLISATFTSFKDAEAVGNRGAQRRAVDELEAQTRQAVTLVSAEGEGGNDHRTLEVALRPVVDEVPPVGVILADAGWRLE